MKILSVDESAAILRSSSLDGWLRDRARVLRAAGDAYTIPAEPAARIALAKFLSCLLMRNSEACVYLTAWNLEPHFEHLELLYGYRRSAGETRPLALAPVHMFDRPAMDAMISILCLVLVFQLEAWIFDVEGTVLARLTHGGALALYSTGQGDADIRDFASSPDKYLQPMLAFRKSA